MRRIRCCPSRHRSDTASRRQRRNTAPHGRWSATPEIMSLLIQISSAVHTTTVLLTHNIPSHTFLYYRDSTARTLTMKINTPPPAAARSYGRPKDTPGRTARPNRVGYHSGASPSRNVSPRILGRPSDTTKQQLRAPERRCRWRWS